MSATRGDESYQNPSFLRRLSLSPTKPPLIQPSGQPAPSRSMSGSITERGKQGDFQYSHAGAGRPVRHDRSGRITGEEKQQSYRELLTKTGTYELLSRRPLNQYLPSSWFLARIGACISLRRLNGSRLLQVAHHRQRIDILDNRYIQLWRHLRHPLPDKRVQRRKPYSMRRRRSKILSTTLVSLWAIQRRRRWYLNRLDDRLRLRPVRLYNLSNLSSAMTPFRHPTRAWPYPLPNLSEVRMMRACQKRAHTRERCPQS